MVMRRKGYVPLLMLVGLMVAASVSFASDFTTGVIVGQMLSDDSGNKKAESTGPSSKTVIDYQDGQPVVTKVEAFKGHKWRKLESGYFVCPGEYRSYMGVLRCRVPDGGFNGFMGGMTDAQELPLQEALTKMEGKPISLQTIEVHGSNLAVKYQLASPVQMHVTTQDLGVVKQEGEAPQKVASQPSASLSVPKADSTKQKIETQNTDSNTSAFQGPFEEASNAMIGFLDSTFMRVLAMTMLIFAVVTGLMRQNLSAFFMGVMPSIMIMTAPTVIRSMLDTGADSTKPVEDSGSTFPFFLALLLPVLIFFAYRAFMNNRRDSEIDELLRDARRAERDERPSNEPPSVDELRERQQQNTEREPVVVSSSAPAPKVQKEEPVEVQPGKRKIILD